MLLTAHTPCFRAEAGSYGQDVRGLIRQHQFEKVELVAIARPDESYDVHERDDAVPRKPCSRNSACRIAACCCAPATWASARPRPTTWKSGCRGRARTAKSAPCSNCEDFQARRMQARWRNPATGKTEPVHTLNGSGVAVGRALVAVMENYQQADGAITVPEVLRPYMGGLERIA